jgi:hypothetical protein
MNTPAGNRMRQQAFAEGSLERLRKPNRREMFLVEVHRIPPRARLSALVHPGYPEPGNI